MTGQSKVSAMNGQLKVSIGKKGKKLAWVRVESLADASKAVLTYCAGNLVTSEDFAGGVVVDRIGTKVAHISYNGRIWRQDLSI